MRRRLARWAQRLARWLDPPSGTLAQTALALVHEAESSGENGEWKRHQVYARLIRAFPHVRKSELGMAIEQAVQQL